MSNPHSNAPAVETRGLARTFRASRGGGEVHALAGVDIRIERGEVFGLLGPNGAGKTTCIKILTTLLFPSAGQAFVAGFDVVREDAEVRRRFELARGTEPQPVEDEARAQEAEQGRQADGSKADAEEIGADDEGDDHDCCCSD